MLPFFVFGWKLRQWQLTGRWLDLPTRVAWRWRAGAIALFLATLVVMPIAIETWRDLKLRRFMLYDESYVAIGYDEPWSGAIRLVLLLFAMVLTVAFLVLMPRRASVVHAVRHGDDVHLPAAHVHPVPVPGDARALRTASRSGCSRR